MLSKISLAIESPQRVSMATHSLGNPSSFSDVVMMQQCVGQVCAAPVSKPILLFLSEEVHVEIGIVRH